MQHRNDTEAISTIVEKIKADPETRWYAPEESIRIGNHTRIRTHQANRRSQNHADE
ncbi:DUF6887 family protein [Phormidesmis priestleyi]